MPAMPLTQPTDPIPRADPVPPQAPEEARRSLMESATDARRWLAQWIRAKADGAEPGDVRELNSAVTALSRLIDLTKKIEEWKSDELDRPADDPALAERQFRQILAAIGIDADTEGHDDPGDPDALPD